MEEPLAKLQLGESYSSDNPVTISIYENCIEIVVALRTDHSYFAIQKGGVEEERRELNSLLKRIFNKPYSGLKLFSSEIEAKQWMGSINFPIAEELLNGGWSKTAIMVIDSTNFESNLESALTYIKERYDDYKNPRQNHLNIAKSVLNKIFNIAT